MQALRANDQTRAMIQSALLELANSVQADSSTELKAKLGEVFQENERVLAELGSLKAAGVDVDSAHKHLATISQATSEFAEFGINVDAKEKGENDGHS